MSEEENLALNAALDAQLRLFCELMLGSTDAAHEMLQQIYSRALEEPPNCVQLFRIAAELCGLRRPQD